MENTLLDPLMRVFLVQLDSAIKIGETISNHSQDNNGISPDSLIAGLVYRLMVPMEDSELTSSMETAKNILDDDISSDEDLDDEFGTNRLDGGVTTSEWGETVILSRPVKKNNCNCDICAVARACLIRFPTYESPDPLAKMFQDAISNACEVHGISI